jgi:hypothetical protein
MQLLDSLQIQQPPASSERVLNSLQDIANHVQIQSNFCISHPDYKPLELSEEVVARFVRLPLELQNKYMNLRLRHFLYGIYYNGFLRKTLAKEADSPSLDVNQNLENNSYLGVDWAFYERLHESNAGEGYFDPGWRVLRQESDGTLAVIKKDLTLYIERDRHLLPDEKSAAVGDVVAIKKPRNLVQNGFYMAVGNASKQGRANSGGNSETVRIYFNLSPEGAIAVMGAITRQLNEIAIPFSFKALYNPSEYERYDSAVLYFDKHNYEVVRQVVQSIYAQEQPHFRREVPLFTKLLAPGLALAEEPDQKFGTKESFGTNRCQIIANGLLDAWQNGDDAPEGRLKSILQNFSLLRIDLRRTYLNAKSEDIYTTLDLC